VKRVTRKRSQSIKGDEKKSHKPIDALQQKIKAKDMQIMELMKEVSNLREMLVQSEETIILQKKTIKK